MKHIYASLSAFLLLMISCTTDRDITETIITPDPEAVLVHYWNFNNLPSGNLNDIAPNMTLIAGGASIDYVGTGDGFMDDFSPGYATNARNSDIDGSGIRARNPSNTRDLIIELSTVGFKKPMVQFATARSGSGATTQNYSYTVDGTNYITTALPTTTFTVSEDPTVDLVTLDFTAIPTTDNNANFKVKISFASDAAAGLTGNNRFDNLTMEAIPLTASEPPSALSYNSPNAFTVNAPIIALAPTVTGTVITYTVSPALPDGLSIDAATGIISGTPTALFLEANYTVTAANTAGSTTATLLISVNPVPAASVIHYWNFNALPTGTLTTVDADMSLVTTTTATITYPGTGAGYMDQVTPGSLLNAQNGDLEGLGLRVRNPSNTRTLDIKASTNGYKNIVVKFATEKTGSGATAQNYSYSLDGTTFITTSLPVTTYTPTTEPTFDIVTLDLSAISGVNNNPNFVLRINFGGASASGASGNNRFDNLTIQGNNL
ncbi:MAG: Ig domain-containing protein [Flavobacterium sp.]|nr:Ig domain-containing protein [Flavobacterium sp.]